ncbi:CHAT domain-containing protein [Streptomyces sp. NPDC014864]|uniref:CHAT domain-containing protein n=1 Tax=Streptomyces sp. NPDC014864 TaxID=3364924 RepID=UPI0036F8742B
MAWGRRRLPDGSEDALPKDWSRYRAGRDVEGLRRSIGLLAEETGDRTAVSTSAFILACLDRAARADGSADAGTAALTVLRAAVERGEPAVERWAVAWLEALGEPYPRLRWTTVAPEERLITSLVADAPVTALSAWDATVTDEPGFVVGTRQGGLARWEGGALRAVEHLPWTVHAVAGSAREILAGGPDGRWVLMGPREHRGRLSERPSAPVTAVALRPDGWIALGTETGSVLAGPAPAALRPMENERGGRVLLLAWRPDGGLDVVRADGRVDVWSPDPDTAAHTPAPRPEGRDRGGPTEVPGARPSVMVGPVDAAAGRAGRLALARPDGRLLTFGTGTEGPHDIRHPHVRALAWSAGNTLAVCGTDGRLEVRTPGRDDSAQVLPVHASAVAFLEEERLVCAERGEITLWSTTRSGLEEGRRAEDRVTCVATDSHAPHRVVAGTAGGGLRAYDRGVLRAAERVGFGQVDQLLAEPGSGGEVWLVASDTGLYRWRLDEPVEELAPGACTALGAVPGGEAVYALGSGIHLARQEEPLWRHPAPVTSLVVGPLGAIASLDYSGDLVIGTPGRSHRRHAGLLPGHRVLGWADRDSLVCLSGADHRGAHALVRVTKDGRVTEVVGELPPETAAAVGEDGTLVTAHPVRGLRVHEPNGTLRSVCPVPGGGGGAVGISQGRVVLGAGTELEVHDLMPAADDDAWGEVIVRVRREDRRCRLAWDSPRPRTVDLGPEPCGPETDGTGLDRLWHDADSRDVQSLSEAAHRAQLLGERVWAAGIAAAVDRARGPDPDRPVRLRWDIPDVAPLHGVPWELLHDRGTGLLCFQEPPVTTVRTVVGRPAGRGAATSAEGTGRRLTYLLGPEPALDEIPKEMARLARRLAPRGVRVERAPRFGEASRPLRHCDVLHVWAHCGDSGIGLAGGGPTDLGRFVEWACASGPPRLVVLVGCESTRAARLLIEAGTDAVVAMRRTVMTGAVSVLVEDFTVAHASGLAVDQAFARALRAYIRTGHPGAAAVPVIYLREGSIP